MITHSQSVVRLNAAINTMFNVALNELQSNPTGALTLVKLATEITSTRNAETYPFLGDIPAVKEWFGDTEIGSIKEYQWTVANRAWKNSFGVDRYALEDDNLQLVPPKVRSLAEQMMGHKGTLIAELVMNGDTGLAYDGAAFFANRAVNDNLLAGTGTSIDQLTADMTSARAAMMRYKSDTGQIMFITGNTILCSPELETKFWQIVNSTQTLGITGGTSNPWGTWIKEIIAVPYLTDINDWYIFDTSRSLKPFLLQLRKQPTLITDDTYSAMNRTINYASEMRAAAAYALPILGAKIVNA